MIVPAKQLLEVFQAIKLDMLNSEDKSLLVFVANGDVDSMCSSIQLESILGRSDINTSMFPVESYSAMAAICKQHKLDTAADLRSVCMINCGATEDIRRVCPLGPNVRVVVIDSHRPVWHGYNQPGDQDNIVVVDEDDPVTPAEVPDFKQDEDRLLPEERDSDDLSSSSSDEEEEDTRSRDQGGGLQGDGTQAADSMEAGGGPDGGPGSGSGGDRGSRKRQAAGRQGAGTPRRARKQRRMQLQQEQLEHRKVVEAYYMSKAGYGKPSAMLLLQLAYQQQEEDNFHIWLAILGVTDQYIHQRLNPVDYHSWRHELITHVEQHKGGLSIAHMQPGDDDDDDAGLYNNRAKHRLCVRATKDLKIPLLRHWNLFEAMQYTHHIATRMQTWREVGEKQLELFLAAMNIGPNQRKAEYMSMHPEVIPHMGSKLEATAGQFRIAYEALRYHGFEMQYKNDVRILASDYVLAITAMLGRPRTGGLKATDIFREAVDCLYPHRRSGWTALQAGIQAAKQLAQAVVKDGGVIITRGQMQGGKQAGLWIADLSEVTMQNAAVLSHPNSLLRLAFFLRDARAQRLNTVRPLVVVGPMSTEGMCYVVAIRATQQAGVMQNNPFSVPFQEALRDLGAGEAASLCTFDNAVFLIKKSAVTAFIEELKTVVQAYRAGVDDARMV